MRLIILFKPQSFSYTISNLIIKSNIKQIIIHKTNKEAQAAFFSSFTVVYNFLILQHVNASNCVSKRINLAHSSKAKKMEKDNELTIDESEFKKSDINSN